MDTREHTGQPEGPGPQPDGNPLARALFCAQLELKNPKKDRENPYFNSRYATLDALQDASKTILAKYGLSITQTAYPADAAPITWQKVLIKTTDKKGVVTETESFKVTPFLWHLRTVLMHSSGQTVESIFPLIAVSQGPQAFGSELTYMRRYARAAILDMAADEDDDANTAQGNQIKAKTDILDSPLPEAWKRPHEYKGPVDTDNGPDDIPGLPSQKDSPPVPDPEALSPTPPEEQTLLEQVRDHLHTDNLSEEQLMMLLRQFKLTRAVMLKDVDSKTLSTVIGKWETVSKRIKDDLARKEEV